MNAILGLVPPGLGSSSTPASAESSSRPRGPLKVYTRYELLRLSKKARTPILPPLQDWFGPLPPARVEDPAIASINVPGGRRTGGAGSFGEGFGFGVGIGIGGRSLGRGGTRNIGLRRQPQQDNPNIDPAIAEQGRGNFGGPMGKFAMRPSGERGLRLGGDEVRQQRDGDKGGGERRRRDEGDWRRGDRQQPSLHHTRNGEGARRGPPGFSGPRYDDDSVEPAWMTDDTPAIEDPAIASSSAGGDTAGEGLVQFVPGEDKIAAHKRAMKARAAGGVDNWRATEKPLVSFFGGHDTSTTQTIKPPAKPKEVNNASYFKKRTVIDDDDDDEPDDKNESLPSFQSRFQRFFAQGSTPVPGSLPVQPPSAVVPPVPSAPASMPPQQLPQARPSQISPIMRGPSEPQQPSPSPGPLNTDDHLAKLMGVLSTKGISPAPPSMEMGQQRPPSNLGQLPTFPGDQYPPTMPPGLHYAHSPTDGPRDFIHQQPSRQASRPDLSPERPEMPPHMMPQQQHRASHYPSPPPGSDPRGYPFPTQRAPPSGPPGYPRPGMGELPVNPPPPFYDRMVPPPAGDHLLQMLQRGAPGPHPMGMLPPHPGMYGPPPGGLGGPGPSPDELLRNLQGGGPSGPHPAEYGRPPMGPGGPGYGPPPPPMQGYLPPNYYPGGPPGPPPGMGPGGPRPPGMMPYPGAPNQDMLAALLGQRTNGH
ncbi:hypothetical protein CC85DRAFT_331660 [Cutaneotrichosporon oleaginosum]|uniref:Uncharacterized protein n=1 Tax=Cutaneotrichosporon oleaginosum TaxID=879819 RepID=A0A0J0XB94_9TREE|nr:uncharacterized protein CC85DRAFT_331660 [Cutaneotrichosporon oleaginosum]KLT38382.1 hypothetical protein CC85DRAFT_331660 [Cutaneotrichosporon oleaginosum]TXT07808.1 hypothetical protein COLE_04732 [Cutaneotrichosporon oleaginosum]